MSSESRILNSTRRLRAARRGLGAAVLLAGLLGCQSVPRPPAAPPLAAATVAASAASAAASAAETDPAPRPAAESEVRLAAHQQDDPPRPPALAPAAPFLAEPPAAAPGETLADLEVQALANNPALRRMREEAAVEWAQTDTAGALPDPTLGAVFYIPPMRFEPDRQVAEVQVMQMIPWLGRLNAQTRQAYFEALAAENAYRAERLRVVGEVRGMWFRLYVLGKQLEITAAEQVQLRSLIETANARVATGDAEPGDVLMATLELSNLEQQQLATRQELASAAAELNRLAGRDAATPLTPPTWLQAELPDWNHEFLRGVAWGSQPELNAARLQAAAARWGIEAARLQRRPDLTVSGGWVAMDAPGAMMAGDGADTWTLGFSTNLPVWRRKYDGLLAEASREHAAAQAGEEEVRLRLDAALRDLWAQAEAARETVALYERTILPQARQTYEANLKSLANGRVPYERVIRDFRTLLNLELGYHRALGQLATILARIRQTVGVDLAETPAAAAP